MRNVIRQSSQQGIIRFLMLALITAVAVPGQVFAQAQTCNSSLGFMILNEPPYFVGEPMRVSADMGAKDILGGEYLDIPAFGFATDCKEGETFHNCSGTGADVEFLENFSTDCIGADGEPAQLLVPEGIVPIRVKGTSIRTAANQQCNVQFDFQINELDPDSNHIVQAMGWPVPGEAPTVCDNELTTDSSSTIGYDVETCEIDTIKEVSLDREEWFDANSEEFALRVGPDDTVYYRLRVRNTGSAEFIGNLDIVDTILGIEGSVAPSFGDDGFMIIEGEFAAGRTCATLKEGGYGFFTNEASVEGTCRSAEHSSGKFSAIDSDIAVIDCYPLPDVDIEKSTNGEDADSAPGPYIMVGDPVNWTYTITNTGDDALTLTSLVDDKVPALGLDDCSADTLAAGASTTCSASSVAGEGQYENTATVTAMGDHSQMPADDSDMSHYFGLLAAINLEKTPDVLMFTEVGQVITYTFDVRNDSNVVLTNVYVSDPLPRLSAIDCGGQTELAVGETMECTATYEIEQADIDATVVHNEAMAYGTAPDGTEVSDDAEATVNSEPVFSLTLDKTAVPLTFDEVGDPIAYAYLLTNSGNQTLYPPYSVVDDKATVDCPDGPDSLPPGGTVLCSAGYTILDGDVALGQVTNEATATAKDSDGGDVDSNMDTETVYFIGLTVRKEIFGGIDVGWLDANTADDAPVKYWPAGALYRIVVTNNSAIALTGVTVTDTWATGSFSILVGAMAAGEVVTLDEGDDGRFNRIGVCTESGEYLNTATGSGVAILSGAEVNHSDPAYLVCSGLPEIEVVKYIWDETIGDYVDVKSSPVQAPSGAKYKITVENTGDVDLEDVVVSDSLLDAMDPPVPPFEIELLAREEIVTLDEGNWPALNMSEVCGTPGVVGNKATASGTSVERPYASTDDDDIAALDCIGPPMISIVKEVSWTGDVDDWHDANEAPYPTAVVDGTPETALYRLTVGNVGDVPLFDVVVNDDDLGITNYPIGTLAVGETVVLDQGDIPALAWENICASTGEKTNMATTSGTSAANVTTDQMFDWATVDCIGEPMVQVVKEVSDDGLNWSTSVTTTAPSNAYWRITLTNVGNVNLVDILVDDARYSISDYMPMGQDGPGTLRQGESVVIDDGVWSELFEANICDDGSIHTNIVNVDGKAADSPKTVSGTASATLTCEEPELFCGPDPDTPSTPPYSIRMFYDGTYDSDHHQGDAPIINPDITGQMPDTVRVVAYDKPGGQPEIMENIERSVGQEFTIGPWHEGGGGSVPRNIWIEFYDIDSGVLLQSVIFHGSCSAPLVNGDEFGGATIDKITAQP
jgi:hypothetical protein